MSIATHSLEVERCCILASQLGAMERQLQRAIAYARSRRQFGQPIGKFQSVSNRVADMKLRIETARLLLYKVAWLVERGQPAMMEAALLKLYLSEAFVESGLDAIRIHGGAGYLSETGVERDLRDAVGGVLYAGTSDIQRNIVVATAGTLTRMLYLLPHAVDRAAIARARPARRCVMQASRSRMRSSPSARIGWPGLLARAGRASRRPRRDPRRQGTRCGRRALRHHEGWRGVRPARSVVAAGAAGVHRARLRHPPPRDGTVASRRRCVNCSAKACPSSA